MNFSIVKKKNENKSAASLALWVLPNKVQVLKGWISSSHSSNGLWLLSSFKFIIFPPHNGNPLNLHSRLYQFSVPKYGPVHLPVFLQGSTPPFVVDGPLILVKDLKQTSSLQTLSCWRSSFYLTQEHFTVCDPLKNPFLFFSAWWFLLGKESQGLST